LLLVSHNFLGSDYGYDIEMNRAMQRHESGDARVIPVILRPCDWTEAPFAKQQALPTDSKPIVSWKDQNEVFATVAKRIRDVVKEIRPKVVASAPGVAARPVSAGAPSPSWNAPRPTAMSISPARSLADRFAQAVVVRQAHCCYQLGRYRENSNCRVEYAYRHWALKIFEQYLGKDHPNTQIVRKNLKNLG
jgi:hypothetical protein